MLKEWGEPSAAARNKKLQPSLLGQGNVPKPLHGINPRTIMGQKAWDQLRRTSKSVTPYCRACGKDTLALDLHEDYNIDYKKGIMTLEQYVTLCKECHMFIHSGLLLRFTVSKKVSKEYAKQVVEHGFKICRENDIKVFAGTIALANALKIPTKDIKVWKPPMSTIPWEKWRLVFNNKTYYGMSRNAWLTKYGSDVK